MEVNLKFVTCEKRQKVSTFPFQFGIENKPSWFSTIGQQEQKSIHEKRVNIKTKLDSRQRNMDLRVCPAFIDLLKTTIVIPCPHDMEIITEGEHISVNIVEKTQEEVFDIAEQHSPEQFGKGLADSHHIKIDVRWQGVSDKSLDFLMHEPVWHKTNHYNFIVLPGRINFFTQHGVRINMIVPKTRDKRVITIEAGDILAYLTPLENATVNLSNEWVTQEEYYSYNINPFSWTNLYPKVKKFLGVK